MRGGEVHSRVIWVLVSRAFIDSFTYQHFVELPLGVGHIVMNKSYPSALMELIL